MHMYFWLISLCFRYFKKPLNIFLGFIPEIVFMASLFGYLVLLVFYKWTSYNAYSSKDAPSLLIHFINMCLFNYNDPTNKALYPGQVPSLKSSTFTFLNFIFHPINTILDCSDLRIFVGLWSMIRLFLCHDSKVSKVSLIDIFIIEGLAMSTKVTTYQENYIWKLCSYPFIVVETNSWA